MGAVSEGEWKKKPHFWSSLADSKTPFSTASPSGMPDGMIDVAGMVILSWGRGSEVTATSANRSKTLWPLWLLCRVARAVKVARAVTAF
jgi:hypothetical protein